MKTFFFCISFLVGLGLAAEFNDKAWIAQSVPKYPSKAWEQANQSRQEFEVKLVDGKILAGKVSKRSNNLKKVSNGVLIAEDHGEFGGGLYQKVGERKTKVLIRKGQFSSIFEAMGKTYVLDGLAHLGLSRGRIFQLGESGGSWKIVDSIDLQDAPYAYCFKSEEEIYLVTSSKLIEVNLRSRTVLPIIEEAFWWGMYPNSIIKESLLVQWIGMRGGILKVKHGKELEVTWFTKPSQDERRSRD